LDYVNYVKRNKKKEESYYQEARTPKMDNDKESGIQKMLAAIKELPENQQIVLKLFYIEEYSLKEIGEILEDFDL